MADTSLIDLTRSGAPAGAQTVSDENGAFGGGFRLLRSFALLVALPTFLALFYYGLVATEAYVAEAKIVVRKSTYGEKGRSTDSLLSSLGVGANTGTAQDGMIVLDYIKSRSVINDVGGTERLRALYDVPTIDWLSRLDSSEPLEDIWSYWKDHVTVGLDTLSGIITLRIKAYDRNDALVLNQDVLRASEKLINHVSRRSREDTLARAKEEVDKAATDVASSRVEMLNFQQKIQSVDPVETAKTVTELLTTLSRQKVAYEAQLARTEQLGVANKPGQLDLKSRINALEEQIDKYQKQLVGHENPGSLSAQLKDFELLKLKIEFDEHIYSLARSSYEEARRQLDRQELYLAVVVPPSLPEKAAYPEIISQTLLVFVICFVLWSIMSLISASIRDSIN
ncbi:hypothetical protein [Rhizobium terrae]|uniref:hypothetical protein n=1 Tax=Rhizobium terrae TaxID=2171756 RepID=UPI000E3DADAF|nr:hypothetical protein [Rhizobium terrae]